MLTCAIIIPLAFRTARYDAGTKFIFVETMFTVIRNYCISRGVSVINNAGFLVG